MNQLFGYTPPSPPEGFVGYVMLFQQEDGSLVLTVRDHANRDAVEASCPIPVGELANLKAPHSQGDVREALEACSVSLKHAIEIIKTHVPIETLGIEHDSVDGSASWPLLEEYLHHMRKALEQADAALSGLSEIAQLKEGP